VEAGVAVTDGDADGARLRQVQNYFSFRDPEGHLHEIAWGPISDFQPFVSPLGVTAFVTEGLGLGHVVLTATKDFGSEADFWLNHGFRLSDILNVPTPAGNAQLISSTAATHASIAWHWANFPFRAAASTSCSRWHRWTMLAAASTGSKSMGLNSPQRSAATSTIT